MSHEHFKGFVRFLKSHYPKKRVSVRRVPVQDDRFGDCDRLKDGSFRIRIGKHLDEGGALHMLIHEWAHVLSWRDKGPDHGLRWVKAYRDVYELYEQWIQE